MISILICTLPERVHYLRRLLAVLEPQVARFSNEIEIRIHDAGRSMPTGTKRNAMIAQSDATHVGFIDCDDMVAHNYAESIVVAARSNPDVITFCGKMTTNGLHPVDFIIKLGEKYEERGGKYYRFPNHLTFMKKELIKDVKFPDIWQGEDYQFSKKVNDLNLLKTEVHIPEQLYFYEFRTNK